MRKILRQITKIITFVISFLMIYRLTFWVLDYLNLDFEFRYFDKGLEWLKNSEGKYIWSKLGGFFLKNNNPYFYENGKFVFDVSSISIGFVICFFTMQLGYFFWNSLGNVLFINKFKQEVYVIETGENKKHFITKLKDKNINESINNEVSENVDKNISNEVIKNINVLEIPEEFNFKYMEDDLEFKYSFKKENNNCKGKYELYAFDILDHTIEINLDSDDFEEIFKIVEMKKIATKEKNNLLEKKFKEG